MNRESVMRALVVLALAVGASPAGAAGPAPTTARGANFLIKSQLDPDFCIAVDPGTDEERAITLQQCSGADMQRWVFTLDADGSNLVVESQGMCLDGNQRIADAGLPLKVSSCRFVSGRKFIMLPTGQIRNVRNGRCLAIPGAASNAAVSLAVCDESQFTQLWRLAH